MTNNHTQQEIAKFDDLAKNFWDKEGAFKTLHQINPIRLAFIEEFIDLSGKDVVDVGCGGGILAESLDAKGAVVAGIDLSAEGIDAAKAQQQLSGSSVDYQCLSTTDYLAALENPLDAVFCMEMLEHVTAPSDIIADCAQMVKAGGLVVFSTINRTIKAHALAVIVAEYVMQMVPKGTHDPKYFIKPSELLKMAEKVDLQPLDIMGFEYRPLSGDFVKSRNTDINYIFAFQKAG